MNLTFKKLITAIIFFVASHTALANADSIENTLYQSTHLIYKNMADYYLFSALEADPSYGAKIDANINSMDRKIIQLNQSNIPSIIQSISPITKQWIKYKSLLSDNRKHIQENGFANGNNEYKMGKVNMQLSTALNHLYDQTTKTRASDLTAIIRSQSIDLRVIVAIFSAQYTVSPEQLYSGEIKKKDLTERLETFTKKLRTLSKLNADKHVMNSINRKWNMIYASIKTKQNNVPFLVSKYSNLIIRDLEKLH